MDSLREQLLVSKFSLVSGCAPDQSRSILQAAHWQFETALSIFFQESTINPATISSNFSFGHSMMTQHPNTPATPPQLPEALLAFSKLSASDSCTPSDGNNLTGSNRNISPSIVLQPQTQQNSQQPTGAQLQDHLKSFKT